MTTPSHPRPDRWRDVTPDDRAHDAAAHEFWGDQADWSTPRARAPVTGTPTTTHRPATTPALAGRSVVGGGCSAEPAPHPHRTHAADHAPADDLTTSRGPIRRTTTFEDASEETWDERWENTSPPAPAPRSGVDPLLARFGGLAVIVTLLVPAFLGFTSDSDDTDTVRTASAPLQIPSPADVDGTNAVTPASHDTTDAASAEPTTAGARHHRRSGHPGGCIRRCRATASRRHPPNRPADDADVEPQTLTAPELPPRLRGGGRRLLDPTRRRIGHPARRSSRPQRRHTRHGTVPRAVHLPSRRRGHPRASHDHDPSTPTTHRSTQLADRLRPPPARRRRPDRRRRNRRRRPSHGLPHRRPATPPPASPASPAEVQAIIRAVWPDELENRAIEIAQRESNFIPTAKNSCCYGVFQMYWSVHKGWLAGLGITSAEQLYDPTLNARAALALYERSGGWGPWGG